MKEKVLLIFFLCNVALFVSAQSHMEKGLQSISRSSTEAIINFLAGDELQGREAGFHGSRVASEYIVSLGQVPKPTPEYPRPPQCRISYSDNPGNKESLKEILKEKNWIVDEE